MLSELRGTIQNGVLKYFMVRNTYIYPPWKLLHRVTTNVMGYALVNMTLFNSVRVLGYHMQDDGANSAFELAFTISDGLEYVRTSIEENNLKVDDVAPRLSFFWGIGMSFYTDIAKMKEKKRIWEKLMKEQYQPQNSKSLLLRAHCQTSGYSLMECQLSSNVVCTSVEALATAMWGDEIPPYQLIRRGGRISHPAIG